VDRRFVVRWNSSAENVGNDAVIPINRLLVVLFADVGGFAFLADETGGSGFVSQKNEAADIRRQNYKESVDWYNGIVADIFG